MGGIEIGIGNLVELISDDYNVKIVTMNDGSAYNTLFQKTIGVKRYEYKDSGKISFLYPSLLGRIIMLPILLYNFWGVRRFFPDFAFGKLFLFFKMAFYFRLKEKINRSDLVICFSGTYLGILSQNICSRIGIPIVFSPSIHPGKWNDSKKALEAYSKSDAVITYLNTTKKYLLALGNISNIYSIPLPIKENFLCNDNVLTEEYKLSKSDFIVLFIGRRENHKGLNLILEVFPDLLKKVQNAKLVIIGPSVTSNNVNTNMDWCFDLGKVSEDIKCEALSLCDVFCMPSKSESLGLVYLEAWSKGKPIVAYDIPEMKELISDGVDGNLIRSGNNLLSVLTQLGENREKREQMGKLGKEKYEKYFSNSVLKEKWISIIENELK